MGSFSSQQCCEKLEVDIIALDFATRLPFYIKAPQIGVALERGIFFEISYGGAILDATARRNILSNAIALANITRGRNLVLSSGAERPSLARGPYDAANLARLWGLTPQVQCVCVFVYWMTHA